MRPDVLYDIALNDRQIMFLLGCSQSTWYRWLETGFPRLQHLVLRSLATGLPIAAGTANLWEGWRFRADGALYGPTGYPLFPYDLWVFEFLNKNGAIGPACDQSGIDRPRNQLAVVNGGRS